MPTNLKVSQQLLFRCLFAHVVGSVAQDFLRKKVPVNSNKSNSDSNGHRDEPIVLDLCGNESTATIGNDSKAHHIPAPMKASLAVDNGKSPSSTASVKRSDSPSSSITIKSPPTKKLALFSSGKAFKNNTIFRYQPRYTNNSTSVTETYAIVKSKTLKPKNFL